MTKPNDERQEQSKFSKLTKFMDDKTKQAERVQKASEQSTDGPGKDGVHSVNLSGGDNPQSIGQAEDASTKPPDISETLCEEQPEPKGFQGSELLLEFMGCLVVGTLVVALFYSIKTILLPFTYDLLGIKHNNLSALPWQAIFLAVFGYTGYVINVFRQVQGLGIFLRSTEGKNTTDQMSKKWNRVIYFMLLLILICPTILIGCYYPINGIDKVIQEGRDRLGNSELIYVWLPSFLMFLSYLVSVFFYLIWDYASLSSYGSNGNNHIREQGWIMPYMKARNHYEYVCNWRRLAYYALGFGMICALVLFYIFWTNRTSLSLDLIRQMSFFCLLITTFLTYGYSLSDWNVNICFYFPGKI